MLRQKGPHWDKKRKKRKWVSEKERKRRKRQKQKPRLFASPAAGVLLICYCCFQFLKPLKCWGSCRGLSFLPFPLFLKREEKKMTALLPIFRVSLFPCVCCCCFKLPDPRRLPGRAVGRVRWDTPPSCEGSGLRGMHRSCAGPSPSSGA